MINGNGLYRFTPQSFKQLCRDHDRAQARIDAAACDCWKVAGPICEVCQRMQAERSGKHWELTEDGFIR